MDLGTEEVDDHNSQLIGRSSGGYQIVGLDFIYFQFAFMLLLYTVCVFFIATLFSYSFINTI